MKTIQSDSYPIFFEDSIAELKKFVQTGNYSRSFILTDEHTSVHCLPLVQAAFAGEENFDIIEINSGEENKNIDFCIGIWKMLIDFEADRKALMINLGGGVITDMGGFAASTFKRGIDFVQVPTTLLSQVDASVGGKTGIDMDNIKNIIGTFTQPKAVFISEEFLKTLPPRQILSGTAEMLKHGLIMDAAYWQALKNSDLSKPTPELIYRSVEIKNEVVIQDPKEKGIRKALNFGHTIGHAVETNSLINDKDPLTHGEAIALGMICEAYLSYKKTGLRADELDEIAKVVLGLYPKYNLAATDYKQQCAIMLKDKKNQNGKINCTLLTRIGECSLDNICTEEELCESLAYYAGL
ncbi:3-dehydroquinate synthase [Mucilaginibacter sp. L3T2-6]|uniref:3-dehydroquinate synthase n=1 Tax=Mucilaginibacter sp. L3T2-6 TaxID=3062491 RepID=UPI002676A3E5|nr:3-dehydroquinate synthase [Mucilaginibacter sp. L3T2-6]MDO3644195.1 3-dehydroquinate synthase [Mucilaginibacter sp. L3T2-6]MDV6216708.1 3-dehydroquinate synthase [Mucilaginibacter sp. L3T2-6]